MTPAAEHARELELATVCAEQPPPVAEHDRDQVDLELVEHALAQKRLREAAPGAGCANGR